MYADGIAPCQLWLFPGRWRIFAYGNRIEFIPVKANASSGSIYENTMGIIIDCHVLSCLIAIDGRHVLVFYADLRQHACLLEEA